MRDEAEKKVLTALYGAEGILVSELIRVGAGKFSAICATLARLETAGFVTSRKTVAGKAYTMTRKGIEYWIQWRGEGE